MTISARDAFAAAEPSWTVVDRRVDRPPLTIVAPTAAAAEARARVHHRHYLPAAVARNGITYAPTGVRGGVA